MGGSDDGIDAEVRDIQFNLRALGIGAVENSLHGDAAVAPVGNQPDKQVADKGSWRGVKLDRTIDATIVEPVGIAHGHTI